VSLVVFSIVYLLDLTNLMVTSLVACLVGFVFNFSGFLVCGFLADLGLFRAILVIMHDCISSSHPLHQ
jgi:hypothetical protein